jgi:phospholipase/carboxylesterase
LVCAAGIFAAFLGDFIDAMLWACIFSVHATTPRFCNNAGITISTCTMNKALVIQEPQGAAAQLLLFFHGVGATPEGLAPLAQRIATEFSPFPSDLGGGFQFFSVRGITEENRPERVAQAMPQFIAMIRAWQLKSGVSPNATAVIGFSQGAIMALEASQFQTDASNVLAGRVIAIAGRFAVPPTRAPAEMTLHFIHGKADQVIPYAHTISGAERLIALGADVTADVIPFLDHAINSEVEDLIVQRLKTYAPKRIWEEALRGAATDQ